MEARTLSQFRLIALNPGCWSLKRQLFVSKANSLFHGITGDTKSGCLQNGLNPQIFVSIVNNPGYSPSKLLSLYLSNLIKSIVRIMLLLNCLELALPVFAAETSSQTNRTIRRSRQMEHPIPSCPGTNDRRIAHLTARMLEQFHYLHQKFDAKVSSRFLDPYLDTLDPQHMHF